MSTDTTPLGGFKPMRRNFVFSLGADFTYGFVLKRDGAVVPFPAGTIGEFRVGTERVFSTDVAVDGALRWKIEHEDTDVIADQTPVRVFVIFPTDPTTEVLYEKGRVRRDD